MMSMGAQITGLKAEVARLTEQLATTETSSEELTAALADAQAKLATATAAAIAATDAAAAEHTTALAAVRAELETATGAVTSITAERDEMLALKATWEAEKSALTTELAAAKNGLAHPAYGDAQGAGEAEAASAGVGDTDGPDHVAILAEYGRLRADKSLRKEAATYWKENKDAIVAAAKAQDEAASNDG